MKILLVSSGSGSRGGGEIFLVYLAQGLTDRGNEVLVWLPSHPRMDELADKCSRFGRVIRTDYRNTYDYAARSLATCFNRATSRRIAREWKGLQPDVIHLNKQNLEDGLDLLRATSDCGVPSVCTIHLTQNAVYLGAKVARLRNWIARNALCKHKGVLVAVQEARRAELDGFLGNCARTRTVLNGVPIPDLERVQDLRVQKRRELGLKDDDLLVLGLGRLVEQKRPDLFLTAARELHRQFPTTKFLWLGDGKFSPNWDERVVREKLGGIVSRTDWNSEVLPFLSAADLLLHVAEYEGLPLAVIEAMSAKVPCAIRRNLTIEMPFFNDSNVIFVDDAAGLAAKLRDGERLAAIASNGRQLVEEKFSVKTMAIAYERLYLEAAAR